MLPFRSLLLAASIVSVAALTGACGGGGDDGASADPSSHDYDPAKTTLHDAGLQVCGEQQQHASGGLASSPSGLASARTFAVASDCNGQTTSPDTVAVYQFTSGSAVPAGATTIQEQFPRGETLTRGPLVILTTGPHAEENLAAIEKALPEPTTTTSA